MTGPPDAADHAGPADPAGAAGRAGHPGPAGAAGRAGPVRVVVADDHEVVRAGFAGLLATQSDFDVVGTAHDGADAVRVCRARRADVVLMDVRMPGLDGIEATRRIAASGGRTRVLILTTFDLDEYAFAGLRAGASGFLIKDALPDELLAGIRAVASGDAVVAPALTRRLIERYAHLLPAPEEPAGPDPRLAVLTDREREVLRAVALGWTNGEIAERMHLAESTVKTHIGRILGKTGARDRVQAVIFAYDTRLVHPG